MIEGILPLKFFFIMLNAIRITNLNKSYKIQNKPILEVFRNYSLEIPRNTITAIMGKSGCGKSTLLQIIGLLDVPNSGSIELFGENMTEKNASQLREFRKNNIGFVFQNFYLLPELTVYENIELPLLIANKSEKSRIQKINLLLDDLGMVEKKDMYPSQLSGGQIQRVAIARALANDPKLILADEPTGNLDEQTAKDVLSILKNIQKKSETTIILVTHSHEVAKECSNIINLT
jgi:ABC-type lipoprotein export system ATPase subunit